MCEVFSIIAGAISSSLLAAGATTAAAATAGAVGGTVAAVGATAATLGVGAAIVNGVSSRATSASRNADALKAQANGTLNQKPVAGAEKTAMGLKETDAAKRTISSLRIPLKQNLNTANTGLNTSGDVGLNIPM